MFANDGHDIVIYERFDTTRPVGSGLILQPTGLSVLLDLGLSDAIHSLGSRIDRIHGISKPSDKTVLNVNYHVLGENLHGLAVHRAALFRVPTWRYLIRGALPLHCEIPGMLGLRLVVTRQ